MNLVVSTLLEAENITPLILESQKQGRKCDLLYGFPLNKSAVKRLVAIARAIGLSNLSVMIDHVDQLGWVREIHEQLGGKSSSQVNLYVKVDIGAARSGVVEGTAACGDIVDALEHLHYFNFVGLYSHAGHSYGGNSRSEAISYLNQEFEALLSMTKIFPIKDFSNFTLAVGATPTTTALRNLTSSSQTPGDEDTSLQALNRTLADIKETKCQIEMHAGVYPLLDVQQLATHALHENDLNWDNLGLTILTEVASLYLERHPPEALIVAGVLALARDPCKAYPGWGILSPWNCPDHTKFDGSPEEHKGWQVAKVSQEHGILRWTGKEDDWEKMEIGQRLRIWPNHACIAGAGFEYYLVVDSRREGKEDEIVDVWVRWNGW